ncbi:MAG: nuclear transport factor 2 family protein [Acidobacteria bacterium]|nr:nuclear transport factor 2 family protein [Acidobacteriota bacterium]
MENKGVMEVAGAAVVEVLRVMDLMEKAWSEKNLPELFRHYWQDDGFVLFTTKGAHYGWPAAKAMLEQYFARLEEVQLEFGARKIRLCGDIASVVYEWRTDGRSALDGTQLVREGYGTDVFLRQNGEWKLYHNHASLARPGASSMPSQW